MRISVQWLREFVSVPASAQEIADKLSVSGLEVEHLEQWESFPGGLRGFVTGQVLTCAKHPNADKLSLTTVDIGTGEPQPIVCGAPNVAAGQKVIVATVGTEVTVPGKGSFTIGEAKIRGEISRGMICAEDEIGIGTSHDGILVLPENTPVGMPAAEYFGVAGDEVMEIGLTANRGDAASHLGVARDVAALFGTHVAMPHVAQAETPSAGFSIQTDTASCSRYVALKLTGVSAKPSPDFIQNRLKALGIEPRNILVDATNFVLHAIGQPIHAFDVAKLQGNSIQVRLAAKGESFATLDKETRNCQGGELLVADASGPVAFAGVMGGLDSAVNETTTEVLIESAHFHPGLVRKTARAHGLSTDASFRFERSTDVEICRYAAFYAAKLILDCCGGSIAGLDESYSKPFEARQLQFRLSKLNEFAGSDIPSDRAVEILDDLGFGVTRKGDEVNVSVPAWRNDVHEVVDLYEEIMRIFGYDNIAMSGKMKATLPVFEGFRLRKLENRGRDFLVHNGFFEAQNNSLTSATHYAEPERASLVQLSNPLSSDMEYMRGSLLPGLLQSAMYNRNRKNHDIRFFEFGNVYETKDSGYKQYKRLALLCGGFRTSESWEETQQPMDFFYVKRMAHNLLKAVGYAGKAEDVLQISAISPKQLKDYDLSGEFWYAEFNWGKVEGRPKPENFKTAPVPRFPYMRRDLSLVLDKAIGYDKLQQVISSQKVDILKQTRVFDVFEGQPLEAGKKAVAIAFYLGQQDGTLTDEIADAAMGKLMKAFETQTGAVIRR